MTPYFNGLPLYRWDILSEILKPYCIKAVSEAEGHVTLTWSLSDGLCIAKSAARIIRGY